MKKCISLLLSLFFLFSVALAESVLTLTDEDLYLDPEEQIERNLHVGSFSFRGPEGWTENELADTLQLINEESTRFLTAFTIDYAALDVDLSDDAIRNAAYDSMAEKYQCTASADAGTARYCVGSVDGRGTIFFLSGSQGEMVIMMLTSLTDDIPALSELSPYAKTLLHD